MKKKSIKNLFLIIFFIFFLLSISKYSFAQENINFNFDWLAEFCEKNSIQISYYGIFAPGGLDAAIGLGQLASSTFLGYDWFFDNSYYIKEIYNYFIEKFIGYTYTIEFGDFSISKKIPLNNFFTYYPGICFYMRYTSDIVVDDEQYYLLYGKIPHELNIKIGTSQSIEYRIKNFIIKFSTNIFYAYYDYYFKRMVIGTQDIDREYMVKGHYFLFQVFLLSGIVVRNNIKLFFGLESMLSTNYIFKSVYYYNSSEDPNNPFPTSRLYPFAYPIESFYSLLENIDLVFYISIG